MAPTAAARRSSAASSSAASNKDVNKRSFQPYHAIRVPKEADLHAASSQGMGGEPVTTLMLRNIPNKYTQSALLQEMDKMGFAGSYDFFYLPMDVHNRSNVGYAFVNFVDTGAANRCYEVFSNYKFQRYHSKKICAVSPAHLQGFEKNVRHFKHRAVMNARDNQYRPVVLRGGHKDDTSNTTAPCSPSEASEDTADLMPVAEAPQHGPPGLPVFQDYSAGYPTGLPAQGMLSSSTFFQCDSAASATQSSAFTPEARMSFEQALSMLLQSKSQEPQPAKVTQVHTPPEGPFSPPSSDQECTSSIPLPPGLEPLDVEETPFGHITPPYQPAGLGMTTGFVFDKAAFGKRFGSEEPTPRTNYSLLGGSLSATEVPVGNW